MVITCRLSAGAFTELNNDDGDPVVVGYLHKAQHGKRLMLLHAVAKGANGTDPVSPTAAAFQAGSKLLVTKQAADPAASAWLFSLLHIGRWARDWLVSLHQGLPQDFRHLPCEAAATAAHAGARSPGGAAGSHRSIPRSAEASDVRRFVGGRAHELAVLHPARLAYDSTAPRLGVRNGCRRHRGDHPAPSGAAATLSARHLAVIRVFTRSWPPDPVVMAEPRCGRIAMKSPPLTRFRIGRSARASQHTACRRCHGERHKRTGVIQWT